MQGISCAGVSVVAVVMFSLEHDVSAYMVVQPASSSEPKGSHFAPPRMDI